MRSQFSWIYAFLKRYLYAAGATLYLFTVGWLSGRNRMLVTIIAQHFGYESVPRKLPEVPIEKVAPPEAAVHLLQVASKDGNVSPLELFVLADLVRLHRPRTVFEFGTFDGRTTLNLAANSDPETTVYTLDLPKSAIDEASLALARHDFKYIDKERSGSRYADTSYAAQIVQLYGDSATFDFTPYLKQIDLVFVDASHSYEYVLSDSANAMQLIREDGGIIVWHDYGTWEGVTRALNELLLTKAGFEGLEVIEGTTLACLFVNKAVPAIHRAGAELRSRAS